MANRVVNYGYWTLSQLKEELGKRNGKKPDRKHELYRRYFGKGA